MHITNLLSQYFGKFAKKEFPRPIQELINGAYTKFMKLDLKEFKNSKHYKSLNELFIIYLIIKREIDSSKDIFISPTDSLITEYGKLKNDTALQIKGMEYSVEELLTYYCRDNFLKLENGEFMNFYLSPRDYHRYHAPVDFKLKKLNKELELFVQNERVVLECEKDGKIFYMVFVGALNVGQMVFEFEPRVETNKDTKEIKVYTYENIEISKADCLGYFKMGSTVVMIWEKDFVVLENLLNQNVKFGQKIAKY